VDMYASLTWATAMESLCTYKPTQSMVKSGMADLVVKVHDRGAVMMQLWPEQGSPAMAPEVSRPSWKS
jgi:hypothetical protein